MAKRRKLETPTAEDLGKIEEAFRRETSAPKRGAPIAQQVAEVAGMYQIGTPEMRRDEAQAAAYRVAEKQGRVIAEVPLDEIEALSLQRDRTQIDAEALAELEHSIQAHGLRLPIELYRLQDGAGGKRFGLLSGYRRLIAQRNLLARTGEDRFARIRAVMRDPQEMGGGFVAMVEENEIRQDLSHFERGRIAAIAAGQGAFATTEAAVAAMFAAASKAKRSKIRSFAMIFEELGDVLRHPEALRERDGLRLAQALRDGAGQALREALGAAEPPDARAEWAAIDAVLKAWGKPQADPARGGRPSAAPAQRVETAAGVTVSRESTPEGALFRLSGAPLPERALTRIMRAILAELDGR